VNLIGITWCKNEGDLLPFTLPAAIKAVDALMIIDDDSTDNSWDVIQSFKGQLEYCDRKTNVGDSRQHLLNEVRRRFGVKDTWVQVIETDTMIFDTDIRAAIDKFKVDDVSVTWHLLNACRKDWSEGYDRHPIFTADTPPEIALPYCHWMERMTYTFRPLDMLHYTDRRTPWPQGFSHYTNRGPRKMKHYDSPLVMHYGFRSPGFYYQKMQALGRKNGGKKYPSWKLGSPQEVRDTVSFYNGTYNNNRDVFDATRQGWCDWIDRRQQYLAEEGWRGENS
jgi:hypothetical protein